MKMENRCYELTNQISDAPIRNWASRKDDRLMVNAMPWLARSGAGWADIPEGYENGIQSIL